MNPALTILFATVTGNAEDCADRIAARAKSQGMDVRTRNVAEYEIDQLSSERTVLLVVSTWGEGEPPDDATPFWEALERMPDGSLGELRFSVFALGDSVYDHFCAFGKNCDRRLGALGATRLLPCVACDGDWEGPLQEWLPECLKAISDSTPTLA